MSDEQKPPAPQKLTTTAARPRHTFRVPESERVYDTDPTTITVSPLRVSEVLDASNVAMKAQGDGQMALSNELIRRSVVAINGKAVDWSSPLDAEWYERCGPKVRSLALRAYNKVNGPSDKGAEDFLDSETIDVA